MKVHFIIATTQKKKNRFFSKYKELAFWSDVLAVVIAQAPGYCRDQTSIHSRPQRPRSFWSAPRITIRGADQEDRSSGYENDFYRSRHIDYLGNRRPGRGGRFRVNCFEAIGCTCIGSRRLLYSQLDTFRDC